MEKKKEVQVLAQAISDHFRLRQRIFKIDDQIILKHAEISWPEWGVIRRKTLRLSNVRWDAKPGFVFNKVAFLACGHSHTIVEESESGLQRCVLCEIEAFAKFQQLIVEAKARKKDFEYREIQIRMQAREKEKPVLEHAIA